MLCFDFDDRFIELHRVRVIMQGLSVIARVVKNREEKESHYYNLVGFCTATNILATNQSPPLSGPKISSEPSSEHSFAIIFNPTSCAMSI